MLPKIVILVFQIYIVHSWRQCDDCVISSACPETYNITIFFKTPESLFQLFQGICGLDGNKPKVCCNDFTSPTTTSSPDLDQRIYFETDTDTSLHHINESIRLLPIRCGITSYVKDRIYGGSVAEINEFPWMALISAEIDANSKKYICGGTIINSKYILTAAHCVDHKKLAYVRVGEYNINKEDCSLDGSICDDHYQDLSIEKKIPHERYLSNGNTNMPSFDIALIRVKGEIDFKQGDKWAGSSSSRFRPWTLTLPEGSQEGCRLFMNLILKDPKPNWLDNASVSSWFHIRINGLLGLGRREDVAPICLPLDKEHRESNLVGEEVVVAGWGNIETGSQSTVLLKVKISILKNSLCHRINNTICAGSRGKDACHADSGGPLMMEHPEADRYVQYGVVSFGNTDCGTGSGSYTDVRKYIDWILDKIEK